MGSKATADCTVRRTLGTDTLCSLLYLYPWNFCWCLHWPNPAGQELSDGVQVQGAEQWQGLEGTQTTLSTMSLPSPE